MTKAESIFNRYKDIQYGMYDYVNKKYILPDDKEFEKPEYVYHNCCVQKPDETAKSKVGTCWDTSLLTHVLLKFNKYRHVATIFISDKDMSVTHATTLFKETATSDWSWIELSWDGHKGINKGRYHFSNTVRDISTFFGHENGVRVAYTNTSLDINALLRIKQYIKFKDYLNIAFKTKKFK